MIFIHLPVLIHALGSELPHGPDSCDGCSPVAERCIEQAWEEGHDFA